MDKIILKSNLVINLLGKREVTLEELQDIDELLLDGFGINFSSTEIENIKHDLQYIFASIKENASDISFANCPDSIKEYIIKNVPTEDIYFEGYQEFFDELRENKVTISEEFQKYLGDTTGLTEYEIFQYIKTSQLIDLQPVITVKDLELVGKYGNFSDFKVKVESLKEYEQIVSLIGNKSESSLIINKNLMQQLINGKSSILPTTKTSLQVESMTEVTPEQLSYFSKNINLSDIRVSYGLNDIDDFYSIEDFEKLQSKVNEISSQVDQYLPELDRFMKIYEILGKKIRYEHNENGEPSSRREAHNLKSGLLENTCVCEGYSKILQQVLKCTGIDCKCITGIGENGDSAHAWNQVKIDGQWYNCDLTWDAEKLNNNRPLDYCLQSDEEFISHTPKSRDVERCDTSYDRNKLHSVLDYAVPLEFEERQYDIDEVLSLLQDFGIYRNNGVRISVDMDYETGKNCLAIGNIVNHDEVKWADNKILIDDLYKFMKSYISSYSTTEISKQGLVDFIRNNAGIELVVDDKLKQQLIENGIDLETLYTISRQQTQTVDIQKLGKESMVEQRDTDAKDTVESDLEEQIRNNTRSQQPYHEQPETKTHSTKNPESFRSKMKFEMTQEQYQEILDRHAAAEENFAKEMAENPEKKKSEQAEYGVK